jgi:hypothetical protein
MRLRVLISALVLTGFLGLYVLNSALHNRKTLSSQPSESHLIVITPQVADFSPTPYRVRDTMRKSYLLSPDERFRMAALQLAAMIGNKSGDAFRRVGDHWELSVSDTILRLGDLPAYEDAIEALKPLAEKIHAELELSFSPPLSGEAAPGLNPEKMQAQLMELDTQWQAGERSTGILRKAASATVRLALTASDTTCALDPLLAQAIALMTLAAVQGDPMPLEGSMLAWKLGYSSHARSQAETLSPDHPWRLYLDREDKKLAVHVEKDPAYAFLLMERLAYGNHLDRWRQAAGRYVVEKDKTGLSMLATGMYMSHMHVRLDVAKTITEHLHPHRISVMAASRNQPPILSGPFLTGALYEAYRNSLLEWTLYVPAHTHLDMRSDPGATSHYITRLHSLGTETSIRFAGWLKNLLDSEVGQADPEALFSDIGNPELPMTLRNRSHDAWVRHMPAESARKREGILALMPAMDSRIAHRHTLAGLARNHLNHLELSDRLYASIAASEPEGAHSLQAFLAMYSNDTEILIRLAEDRTLPEDARLSALHYLTGMDTQQNLSTRIRSAYRQLIDMEPQKWSLRRSYISFLKKEKDHGEIRIQTKGWSQRRDKNAPIFDVWSAAVVESEAFAASGDLKQAWESISPYIDGYQSGVLMQATSVKIAMGELDAAERIAWRAHRRYQSGLALFMDLVALKWLQGKYEEAAALLQSWRDPIPLTSWRKTIAEVFVRHAPKMDVEAAFAALMKAGTSPHALNQVALRLGRDNPELAAKLAVQLRAPGLAQISLDLDAHSLLIRAQGPEAAERWLSARTETVRHDAVAGIAMERGQYSVPWRVARPEKSPHPDAIWLYRAAVFAMGKENAPENRVALDHYYDTEARGSFYDELGAMVLGRTSEAVIGGKPMTIRQVSEAAYYLGLRAVSEKRHAEAAEWFRVSLETGEQTNGEYRWSLALLDQWKKAGRSLDILASKNALF